jgi:hypothetical protein
MQACMALNVDLERDYLDTLRYNKKVHLRILNAAESEQQTKLVQDAQTALLHSNQGQKEALTGKVAPKKISANFSKYSESIALLCVYSFFFCQIRI